MSKNVYLSIPGLLAVQALELPDGTLGLHLLIQEDKIEELKEEALIAWTEDEGLEAAPWKGKNGQPLHVFLGHDPQQKPIKVGSPPGELEREK